VKNDTFATSNTRKPIMTSWKTKNVRLCPFYARENLEDTLSGRFYQPDYRFTERSIELFGRFVTHCIQTILYWQI